MRPASGPCRMSSRIARCALHVAMPRYFGAQADLDALVDFMLSLGSSPAAGVLEDTIRIGVVAPTRGPAGELGQAVRSVLRSFVCSLVPR